MMKITDLPRDLVEEVLSKTPLTSLRRIRSTCKNWNTLSKGKSFAKKHLGQARDTSSSKVVMMMDSRIYLMSINLHNSVESYINREAKLITIDEVDVSKVFHCNGLLLCVTKDKLVVWNPYWVQTRFIEPTHSFKRSYRYALGYDKSSNSHKVLRYCNVLYPAFVDKFQIYHFSSDSWRVLDHTPDWRVDCFECNVSLKGNTYWFSEQRIDQEDSLFLVCFDFTGERFGPHLPLTVVVHYNHILSLSSVREEQLAVLFHRWDRLEMEIWVTTKIEPDAVSWNTKVFLAVNMTTLSHFSFLIDEEKKAAVVFDKSKVGKKIRNVVYIVGMDGSLKEAYLGDSADTSRPLVCSYVPSLVQLI